MKFNLSCIQNCATADLEESILDAEDLSRAAHSSGTDLICLPEFFSYLHVGNNGLEVSPIPENRHPALAKFKSLARELQTWILLGSIAHVDPQGNKRNRSILLDSNGTVVNHYDKIHMFDVNLPNGETYRESALFTPGTKAAVADLPWCRLGLTVCYDLRFAYLYRVLAHAGASVISVPAAFAKTTGQAHWHVLLRSRAIETGCYIVAPCQFGKHGKAKTYGHSLIVDPWGNVLADGGENRGYVTAEIDLEAVAKARHMVPALEHDRDFAPPVDITELHRKAS